MHKARQSNRKIIESKNDQQEHYIFLYTSSSTVYIKLKQMPIKGVEGIEDDLKFKRSANNNNEELLNKKIKEKANRT